MAVLSSLCRLYRGEKDNPFSFSGKTGDEWAMEYLKFHIWDAEMRVCTGYRGWLELWRSSIYAQELSEESTAEEVYKFVNKAKLQRMKREDIDFMAMYFALTPAKASDKPTLQTGGREVHDGLCEY